MYKRLGYPPSLRGSEPLTSAILEKLPQWGRYRYGSKVDFPPSAVGVPSSLLRTGSRAIDCSTFTYALLSAVYPQAGWNIERYKKWQMWEKDDLWGPLTMAENELHIGTTSTDDGWHLFQIWRTPWESGHSFVAFCLGGNMLVLEASNASRTGARHDGVVWRDIGPATAPLPALWSGTRSSLLQGVTFGSVKLRLP